MGPFGAPIGPAPEAASVQVELGWKAADIKRQTPPRMFQTQKDPAPFGFGRPRNAAGRETGPASDRRALRPMVELRGIEPLTS